MNTMTKERGRQGLDQGNRNSSNSASSPEDMVRVDGRGQVLEMLRTADPTFRETILRGIESRDPNLARELRRRLAQG